MISWWFVVLQALKASEGLWNTDLVLSDLFVEPLTPDTLPLPGPTLGRCQPKRMKGFL